VLIPLPVALIMFIDDSRQPARSRPDSQSVASPMPPAALPHLKLPFDEAQDQLEIRHEPVRWAAQSGSEAPAGARRRVVRAA
jgi:hypothetical protein